MSFKDTPAESQELCQNANRLVNRHKFATGLFALCKYFTHVKQYCTIFYSFKTQATQTMKSMKKKGKILVVDDNSEILVALKLFLGNHFESVVTERNPEVLVSLLMKDSFDVIVLDMNFKAGINSGNEGLFWLNKILGLDPSVSVVFITAYAGIELAVNAIRMGAVDFIEKPWDDDKLLATILKALEIRQSKLEITRLRNKQEHLMENIDHQYDFFRGNAASMDSIYKTIEKVACTDASILIMGENGTGKEILAREIHKRSTRSREVFVGVDLGALSTTLFESELFGHMKGAFTDARDDRPGRFEIASGGTLFLDEIGNLPVSLQSKLLSTLQSREITRLGSNRPVQVDIRLVSATNSSVFELVKKGSFREDLLYRINTIQIEIPPLRERLEDIPGFLDFFLKKYALKYGKPFFRVEKEAMDRLLKYTWPGNIRELQHMAEKAVIMGEGGRLRSDDFFMGSRPVKHPVVSETLNLELIEKETIARAIEKSNGNISRAVKELGISRRALYYKLKKYDF
jgi:two-component system, NtrC family, response regulator HydG